MTEASRAKRRPGAAPVFWTSLLLFAVLLGLLTYRFSIGHDPSGVAPAAGPAKPVRKVIVRRVVTTVVPAGSAAAASGSGAESAPSGEAPVPASESVPVSAPVTTSAS